MPCIRSRRSNSGCSRNTAKQSSTAGRRTRRGRLLSRKARRFRAICARGASAWIEPRLVWVVREEIVSMSKRLATATPVGVPALVLLMAWLAFTLVAACAQAASLDEIKKRGYMIVATEDDFRPFEFVKDGKPVGFDNELVEELRKYAPFEIKQEILPWTGLLAGVSTGKYDIAVTAAIITKERKQSLDFTSPIADATHYYVKRKSDNSINAIKDLNGKTVGVQAGSA